MKWTRAVGRHGAKAGCRFLRVAGEGAERGRQLLCEQKLYEVGRSTTFLLQCQQELTAA
ncbi:MAG: hypothetical protein M3362_12975 [Acidobacteriota bacterium]|nr:hypothetical protein [Acidobacteriota bacterium]